MNKDQIILTLILIISFTFGYIFLPFQNTTTPVEVAGSNPLPVSKTMQKSLQLQTLKFSSPPAKSVQPQPTPSQLVCWYDDRVCHPQSTVGFCCPDTRITCSNGKCISYQPPGADSKKMECSWQNVIGTYDIYCRDVCGFGEGFTCFGKPVILLYPEKPTLVDVEVKTSGEIYVSDPLYPTGGWKNVLANPNGSLVYEAKNYEELFYESRVKSYGIPKTGLIFNSTDLKTKLPQLLYMLGLNNSKNEIPEFMDFWLPKLKALNSRYVFVSLVEKHVKEATDKVLITPEPDTRIELIVYFKPLKQLIDTNPLTLRERPIRKGFTLVEWGGTIDNN